MVTSASRLSKMRSFESEWGPKPANALVWLGAADASTSREVSAAPTVLSAGRSGTSRKRSLLDRAVIIESAHPAKRR